MECINKSENVSVEVPVMPSFSLCLLSLRQSHAHTYTQIYTHTLLHKYAYIHAYTYIHTHVYITVFPFELFSGFRQWDEK